MQETGVYSDISNGIDPIIHTFSELVEYTGFAPIVITNTTVRENESTARNKLFQYTIEFKFANKRAQARANPLGQWEDIEPSISNNP